MRSQAPVTGGRGRLAPISVLLRPDRDTSRGFSYLIANRTVVTDVPFPELDPLRGSDGRPQRQPRGSSVSSPGSELYSGRGWVGGRLVEVRCGKAAELYVLDVEEAGRFLVSADGSSIVAAGGRPSVSREVRLALLGPCLSLALAAGGTFCLHAGAVVGGGSVVVLMGETGTGKSTLSEFVEREGGSWRRLADDVLPLALVSGEPKALPHFPQLKLSPEVQWDPTQARELPLARIYRLQRKAFGGPVEIRRLSMRNATLAILRATLAARLFDPALREKHLDFAVRVAAARGVHGLDLPSDRNRVPQVLSEILNDAR